MKSIDCFKDTTSGSHCKKRIRHHLWVPFSWDFEGGSNDDRSSLHGVKLKRESSSLIRITRWSQLVIEVRGCWPLPRKGTSIIIILLIGYYPKWLLNPLLPFWKQISEETFFSFLSCWAIKVDQDFLLISPVLYSLTPTREKRINRKVSSYRRSSMCLEF